MMSSCIERILEIDVMSDFDYLVIPRMCSCVPIIIIIGLTTESKCAASAMFNWARMGLSAAGGAGPQLRSWQVISGTAHAFTKSVRSLAFVPAPE